jgi:hypothetical protein
MKKAILFALFLAAPAHAGDHQWCYDRSQWEADLNRARVLERVMDCPSALDAEVRAQFWQIDQAMVATYRDLYRPGVRISPAAPWPGR